MQSVFEGENVTQNTDEFDFFLLFQRVNMVYQE